MQQIPKIGEDVTAIMAGGAPPPQGRAGGLGPHVPGIGDDVSILMGSPGEMTDDGLVFRSEVKASDGLAGGARELWKWINPVTFVSGLYETAKDPIGTAKAMITANPQFLADAKAAAARGDYTTAFRKLMSYGSMGFGNVLDEQATNLAEGRTAEGIGGMAGLAANLMAPAAIARTTRAPFRNANALERAAVKFGEAEGVPIDAATATGSPFVSRTQQMAGANLGGARRAEHFQAAQGDALERTMRKLTGRAGPNPVTAEQAGSGVVSALEGRATAQAATADAAYGRLRQLEADAAPTTVQQPVTGRVAGGGTVQTTQPQQMRMAVDMRTTKSAMRPIHEALIAENARVPFISGSGKGRALIALDKLMDAPDFAPLSIADSALGEVKAMARGARIPAFRNQGQGIAAQTVKHLEDAVMDTARKGGPEVVAALKEGRAATIAKYATEEILTRLTRGTSDEGVKVAARLTAKDDSAIAMLRELDAIAPAEMTNVGRSVLEGLLDTQTQGGVFAKGADGLYRAWHNLGPQTKAILFKDRGLIRDLDNFFLLARKIGQNPNPSGTALTRSATQWLQMAPNWVVAKLLYSPRAVRWLTEGLRMPATRVGQAAWTAELAKVAQEVGVSLTPAGAVVEGETKTP